MLDPKLCQQFSVQIPSHNKQLKTKHVHYTHAWMPLKAQRNTSGFQYSLLVNNWQTCQRGDTPTLWWHRLYQRGGMPTLWWRGDTPTLWQWGDMPTLWWQVIPRWHTHFMMPTRWHSHFMMTTRWHAHFMMTMRWHAHFMMTTRWHTHFMMTQVICLVKSAQERAGRLE